MFWMGWLIFCGVALSTIPAVIALRTRKLRDPGDGQSVPRYGISIVIPARNEELQIGNALTSLLSSTGVDLELIAVNDRSTDQTGRIMDSLAETDPRLKVLHIAELPDGWLGKNHAMQAGAALATRELILFSDGDILFRPRALAAAVHHFHSMRLQHLCLLPKMIPGSLVEQAMTCFFGLAFATGLQLHLIRTRWPLSYAGVGAFNLVDAEFYRSLGGHQQIAMDVLDDVKLGKMIKRNGGRSDFLMAEDWLSVRWQPSLWGVITGLEKNGFASLNYSVPLLLWVTLLMLAVMVFPCIAGFVLPPVIASGFVATAVCWHLVWLSVVLAVPGGWRLIPLFLLGPGLMAFAYWRSAMKTLRQGGVRWRDSFYPLDRLKKALY